jgi:3-hydroxyisobutyrate dehydrogenase
MNVAFLGLGTMGAPMAANLLRKFPALTVWNRTPTRAAELVQAGARLAASPEDAVRAADVAITMLADPAAVRAVAGAILPALRPGAILIDMSTVDPALARELDAQARARGVRFLDAPVSGTLKPAVDGTLLIMAGGPAALVEEVRPIFEAMGRPRRVGDVGQGMAMKLVLNGLGAHMITGFTAMLTLGATQGLRLADMLEVIGGGAFSSPLYTTKGARIAQRDFHPDFTVALMRKDQELVLATAADAGYPMPTQQAIRALLDDAIARGFGELDLCGLVRYFEETAKVTVK